MPIHSVKDNPSTRHGRTILITVTDSFTPEMTDHDPASHSISICICTMIKQGAATWCTDPALTPEGRGSPVPSQFSSSVRLETVQSTKCAELRRPHAASISSRYLKRNKEGAFTAKAIEGLKDNIWKDGCQGAFNFTGGCSKQLLKMLACTDTHLIAQGAGHFFLAGSSPFRNLPEGLQRY